MGDRPVCTDAYKTDQTDSDKTQRHEPFASQKQANNLSTFQNLLESSWMSASFHRSILALGSEEMASFAKPQASDFAVSGLLLYSPGISLPIGRSQHNSLPLGSFLHARRKRELQLSNSHKLVQAGNIPCVLSRGEHVGNANPFAGGFPAPVCSSKQNSDKKSHAATAWLVEAHRSALDGQAYKTSMAHQAPHLERLEMKGNVMIRHQVDPEDKKTFKKNSHFNKDPRQVDSPRRSNGNQTGPTGRKPNGVHWSSRLDPGCSTAFTRSDTFQAITRHSGSTSTPHPKAAPSRQHLLTCGNELDAVAASPQIHLFTTDEEIAKRFQALYQFHLLQRCFRRWCAGLSSHTKAWLYNQRRILSKALLALQRAVLLQRAQTDTAEMAQRAQTLAQAFHRWKDVYERRQQARLGSDSCTRGHVVALRRRLVKASDSLPLRITYCVWRNHVQSQRIHRAAVIHHHLSVLYKHWLLWRRAWMKQISRSQQMQRARAWREQRLRIRTWTMWLCVWKKRQQTRHLHRLVLQRWNQHTQRVRLMHLAQAVEQLRSIRLLSATFRRWRQAKEVREAMQRLRHLQDRGLLQAAFEKWLHSSRLKVQIRELHQRSDQAHLARIFSYWNGLVLHRRKLALSYRRQQTLTVRSFFQLWRRALELRLLQKRFLILLFFKRQRTSQHTSAVQDETMTVAFSGQHSFCPLEVLWARLVLQMFVYTWREKLKKQQQARWHHAARVRERQRTELVEWHRLAQTELSDKVLRFRARLAQFHNSLSTPGVHSSSDPGRSADYTGSGGQQAVALQVLVRMMQPDLSLAFSQWRSALLSSRKMKRRADLFRNSRELTGVRMSFSTWRTHTEMQQRAVQYRERVLLSHCVTDWRTLMWCGRRERSLQLQAVHCHQTRLLKHCFTAWHRQAAGSVLDSRQRWLEQRVESRCLSRAFSTWAARERQQKAVRAFCTQVLLRRVFAAWQKRVQCHKERQEAALSFVQHRLCSVVFSQWKSSCARQQLANSRAKHTLRLSAKHMLQAWREYTHNRCLMHVQLCAFREGRERALKRKAILIWQQAVENIKIAQQLYQQALLCRFYFKWLDVYERNRELHCLSLDIQELRTRRLQQNFFSLWKLQFLHIRTKKQRLHLQVANFQFHQAVRHRDQHVLTRSLNLWRWKLDLKRRRREIALGVVRIWRGFALRCKELRERVQNVQKLQLSHAFRYWARTMRLSIKAREHHTQKQRRRVLLGWHVHTVWAQRMRYSEACFQYRMELRVMGFCLSLWRRALVQTQNQQCVLEDLLSLYHSRLTAQAFQNWRAATTRQRAAKNINTALLRKWFVRWKQRRDALRTADQFLAQKQKEEMRLILTSWSLWVKEHKGRRQMEEAVRLWLDGRRVCAVFHQWVEVYRQHQVACYHSQIHLLHRSFWTWRAAAIETKRKCQTVEIRLQHHEMRSAFRTWRWATASHKAVRYFTQRVKEADSRRLLSAVLQAWHEKTQIQKQRDFHLSDKYFNLWALEVQRRQSVRLLWNRRRTKWMRLWRYRLVERREQRELISLYWASWKSQTAASLLYKQQVSLSVNLCRKHGSPGERGTSGTEWLLSTWPALTEPCC
ncbi:uncharacterized protein LOC103033502 isoform X2 [Astyanax mexicanus]|uniref:uncharacterized protein LOC103033502 isoform X2 n=1 Tax=Astyanax mexicanus TaxID=7994 RepID=UPI0020CAF9C0|nr:uncharacterized protein LOC103033502 isoform X2 [Astyanax mexicanus]